METVVCCPGQVVMPAYSAFVGEQSHSRLGSAVLTIIFNMQHADTSQAMLWSAAFPTTTGVFLSLNQFCSYLVR
jgi:hypothetical protein